MSGDSSGRHYGGGGGGGGLIIPGLNQSGGGGRGGGANNNGGGGSSNGTGNAAGGGGWGANGGSTNTAGGSGGDAIRSKYVSGQPTVVNNGNIYGAITNDGLSISLLWEPLTNTSGLTLTNFKIDTNGSVDIFWGDGSSEVVPDNQNFGHTYS
jgi:hypothetical protein